MSGVLGIELGVNQIRILQGTVAGASLRINNFATEEILVANPESVAQQLELLVTQRGFRSWPAAITLSGPGVVHRLLDFPPMPLKDLGVVLRREIRAGGEGGEENMAFGWEVIEGGTPGGSQQLRVLVAMAPRSQVDEAQQLLSRCGLKPALITTGPVSVLRALKFVEEGEMGQRVFLYLCGQQGYLLGVKEGVWSFYREFSSRVSEQGVSVLIGEAIKEANRALLYYKQHFREGREIGFLLGGEKGLEELRTRLKDEMRKEGEIVRPSPALSLDPLGERTNIFRDLFPSFIIPLGLVAAASAEGGINLVPEKARASVPRWPTVDWSLNYRPVLALFILLVLIAFHLYMVRTERAYESLLAERTSLHDQWRPAIRAAQDSRAVYETQKLLEESLGSDQIGDPSWVALFKALSRLAPPDLVLKTMSVERDEGKWRFTLKGEVVSGDAYVAQVTFNRFYRSLRDSLGLEKLELLPLKITNFKKRVKGPTEGKTEEAAREAAAANEGKGLEIKKTKIQFKFRSQMKEI